MHMYVSHSYNESQNTYLNFEFSIQIWKLIFQMDILILTILS